MLYKFFTLNDNSLSSLHNTSLWFSKISEFNDPFEGRIKQEIKEISDGELVSIINAINENGEINSYFGIKNKDDTLLALTEYFVNGKSDILRNKLLSVIKLAFNAIINNYNELGVCCFVSDSKDINKKPPLENRLMWGHYANGLRGFALKFNKEKIFDLDERKTFGPYIVKYVDNYPVIDLIDFAMQHYINKNKEATDEYILRIIESKNSDWAYENEIRYSHSKGNTLIKYDPDTIESLHIGEKMPDFQRKCLLAIARDVGIKNIFESKLDSESYSIKSSRYVR
ncbi:DUF2971 domain-containing protein [Yersinia proxima]|uniref:DUF2971 domain-containing protein n=1 Tax=Yersinia proxima TaxID=2890316 RepID=UPI001D119F86|nr:DUF2971 domain-containing protein [Yersinia proxima]